MFVLHNLQKHRSVSYKLLRPPTATLYVLFHKQFVNLSHILYKSTSNVKKPKRAEVNYSPSHPHGETVDTLENLRLDLIAAHQKKDSVRSIDDMMSRTYSWRRQEVVAKSPDVAEFRQR